MKIGLVLDDTLDTSDGVQQYVLLVGSWLSKNGHEVHYITGYTSRTDITNIHSSARNVKVSFNKNRLSVPLPTSGKKIKNLLFKEKFDVLHVQMPFSPFLAGKVISYAPINTAIVGTFHVAPHGKSVIFGTRILGRIQKNKLKRFDKIISVSKVAQKFASDTQNISSTIVPNAIDFKLWKPSVVSRPEFDIVFVGRLVGRKGCINLLKALYKLRQSQNISKLKVLIVGDGPERTNLEQYVQDHKLSEICDFKGYVTESEKKKILQSTKLAIYPATGGESFGIVLLEAMAGGAVVLAGSNPGYSTVLGELPEVMFKPNDIDELANKLASLIRNDKALQQIKLKQQKIVKQYDIDIVGSAILETYKQARELKNG